jgi:hypothetical protein
LVALVAIGLVAAATAAVAGDLIGAVARIDPATRTIYFQSGSSVTLAPGATLAIDGQSQTLESLEPGTVVVVRDGAAVPAQDSNQLATAREPRMDPTVSPGRLIDASGIVARVDADKRSITFEDGRTVKLLDSVPLGPGTLDAVHPGETVSVRRVEVVAFRNQDMTRLWMGTVARVEPRSGRLTLEDGTVVRFSGRMMARHDDGQIPVAQLQAGDEIVFWLKDRTNVPDGGSALPLQSASVRILDADRIQILRRTEAR